MRGCAGAGLGIEKPKLTLGPPVAEAAAPDALAPDAAALGGKFGIGRLRGIASSKPRRGATRLRMASEASSRRDTIGEATGSSRLANPFPTACTGLVDAILPKIGSASCRERVCQYVYISVVAVTYKKKTWKYEL